MAQRSGEQLWSKHPVFVSYVQTLRVTLISVFLEKCFVMCLACYPSSPFLPVMLAGECVCRGGVSGGNLLIRLYVWRLGAHVNSIPLLLLILFLRQGLSANLEHPVSARLASQ